MNQSTVKKILLVVACCIAILTLLMLFWPQAGSLFSGKKAGQMVVQVVDGETNAAIEDAKIVIPEADLVASTDASGKTALLTLPIVQDKRFSDILPKTWGEVTLMIYKDGYCPYILINAQIFENQLRDDPVIYLFKGDSNSTPYAIVEGPERLWVNDMIAKYNPYDSADS